MAKYSITKNCWQKSYSSIYTFTVVWLPTTLIYTQIEHAKKSACLLNVGFYQPKRLL